MRVVKIPPRPAYVVYRCFDCPHFKERGAAFGDGDICLKDELSDIRTVDGGELPDWCPEAVEVPDELCS